MGTSPLSFDVGHLVRRTVASLYSSLVTRPTGQAVRLAIENALAEEPGDFSLSIIDLSRVTIIDFSCADEVVAKLLLRFQAGGRPKEVFFVFRGIKELHRDPIEVVLERQSLMAVAETEEGVFELLGAPNPREEEAWRILEERGVVLEAEVDRVISPGGGKEVMDSLVARRVAVLDSAGGEYRALSSLL
ncbi:MAG: hypothetical protein ACQET1_09915 [Gemmatimonadota bacterium]